MNREKTFALANAAVLAAVGAATLFPLYYVLAVSFTDPAEYVRKQGLVLFPHSWSLASYSYLLSTSSFLRATGVSTILATAGTLLSLSVTASFAYGLSRKRLKIRKPLMLMVLLTILFSPGIIPHYLLVRELGLINSVWSLILPVLSSGWYVFLMKSFFDSIPPSLEEAAMMDGCQDVGVFFRIMLPLSLPSLAAFGLFYAVGYWNTYFHAVLYINVPSKWPLQILLQNMLIDSSTSSQGAGAAELMSEKQIPAQTLKMAAVVVATAPILAVYPLLQKHFAKGVMLGSVKE